MNPFKKLWFWLLLISILLFIITLIIVEVNGQYINTAVPWWLWLMFALALIIFALSLILYIVDVLSYRKKLAIAEACGEVPPPKPKPKMECPKKPCAVTKVTECVETHSTPVCSVPAPPAYPRGATPMAEASLSSTNVLVSPTPIAYTTPIPNATPIAYTTPIPNATPIAYTTPIPNATPIALTTPIPNATPIATPLTNPIPNPVTPHSRQSYSQCCLKYSRQRFNSFTFP